MTVSNADIMMILCNAALISTDLGYAAEGMQDEGTVHGDLIACFSDSDGIGIVPMIYKLNLETGEVILSLQ